MGYGWEKKMNGTKKIGDWHIRAIAGLSRKKTKSIPCVHAQGSFLRAPSEPLIRNCGSAGVLIGYLTRVFPGCVLFIKYYYFCVLCKCGKKNKKKEEENP